MILVLLFSVVLLIVVIVILTTRAGTGSSAKEVKAGVAYLESLEAQADPLKKNGYGQYLLDLVRLEKYARAKEV